MRLFTLLLIGCVSVQATAADINVPADQPTIQAAIVAANPGDVVIVAPGTYLEAIDFLGKAITVRSTDPNDPVVVMQTIIDGTGKFHVVQCVTSEGQDTVLSGFIITGGNANSSFPNNVGGGMYNSGSSPTVTNCSFVGNTASNRGGGMYNSNSSPMVANCSFSGNSSVNGGAMSNNNSSSPTVTNCSFSLNTASSGSGMYNQLSSPTVIDCSFIGNTTSFDGGGMYNTQSSNPTVTNCLFNGNEAGFFGGGIRNAITSIPTVTNTGFCNNTPEAIIGAYTDGGGNSLLYCPPPIPVPPSCPADNSGDGNVNVTDLLALLAAWGACP